MTRNSKSCKINNDVCWGASEVQLSTLTCSRALTSSKKIKCDQRCLALKCFACREVQMVQRGSAPDVRLSNGSSEENRSCVQRDDRLGG